MPKITELTTTPRSWYNHIDALLNSSPDWNYFQPTVANTLFYTFVVTPGDDIDSVDNVVAFTPTQQFHAQDAISKLAAITGIKFVRTEDPNQAQISLVNANITNNAQTMGLAAWWYDYNELPDGTFTNYIAGGTLFMDSVEFGAQNADLTPGTKGYETLLHELGHLLGLKHPHDAKPDNDALLPAGQDGSFYTIMSYSSFSQPIGTFAQYDIAALRWLYGGDGLGGARGASEGSGKYLTGTPFADVGDKALVGGAFSDLFEGGYGNDMINGGAGTDFVKVNVPRHLMTLTRTAEGFALDDAESVDQLVSIERILYDGGAIALDVDGVGGQAYRLYNSVLGRAPDLAGLGFWLSNLDYGIPLSAVAGDMMTSPEFVRNFGANLSHQQLVQTLYQNILDRAPEEAGMKYWLDALEQGLISQPEALAFISESVENRNSVDPTIANGFVYTPWG